MSKDWNELSRKEKKIAAKKTLEILKKEKLKNLNSIFHLFDFKQIRRFWLYVRKPSVIVLIIVLLWKFFSI